MIAQPTCWTEITRPDKETTWKLNLQEGTGAHLIEKDWEKTKEKQMKRKRSDKKLLRWSVGYWRKSERKQKLGKEFEEGKKLTFFIQLVSFSGM